MKELFGIAATVLLFASYIPYVRDVIKGKTKPQVYSWFIWGTLSLLVAAEQLQQGGGAGAYMNIAAGVLSYSLFALGLRNGKKDITRLDTFIFIAALVALGIWIFAKQPVVSMLLLVGASTLGAIPTFRKSWNKPDEETLEYWTISPIRHFLSILALTSYNLVTVLNPATWVVINTSLSLLLIFRRKHFRNYEARLP